jgi:hypothetical protein
MIGIWGAHAQTFLLTVAIVTTLIAALPIFLVPIQWARPLGWRIPADTDLALYFGRCLGAFILILEAFWIHAAVTGANLQVAFAMATAAPALMVYVHVIGWAQKVQPLSETIEIFVYGALFVLTLLFWPVARASG